ncbi:MAG: thiolase family protein [Candidatus Thermoplasmatota archaeon]|nr:thiolase family protein [Candidatus Thermoplasmatota archaeon]
MTTPVIVSAVRTPTGKYGRALRDVPAPKLGALVVEEVLKRANVDPSDIAEVIMGNVIQAGLGQNPARQAALLGGLPDRVGAVTINKVCASGLKAVTLAADSIRTGDQDIVVAGGMENMSRAPYLLMKARWGYRHGNEQLLDAMVHDGLWDVYNQFHMGITGEVVAEKYGITREEQDEFSYQSHMKALKAIKSGGFKEEVMPVPLEGPEGETLFEVDEGVRPDTSVEKLARLPPVFKDGGMVTAGNASQLSDGAAALVVASERKAEEMALTPLARILGYTTGGVSPKFVMEAPIPTVHALLKKLEMTIQDFDLFEHNEAYASASLAVARQLEIPIERLNVKGGAVALGHPLGCTGARILTTLLYAMKERGAKRGLATLCLGGGNAVAVALEAP